MKKITTLIVMIAIIVSLLVPQTVFANNIRVTLNGEEIQFDQPPVMLNDRTLVPVRAIFEAMGATVIWNGQTEVIDVFTEFGVMIIGVGSPVIIYKNDIEDRSIITDVPAQIINNRTLVPVRAIAECTGYNVAWNEETQTVVITGEMKGATTNNTVATEEPIVEIPAYYPNSTVPDFAACMSVELTMQDAEQRVYVYVDVTGEQLIEYVEKYMVSAGFTIAVEKEENGVFTFIMPNSTKPGETAKIEYYKEDKQLYILIATV